MRTKQYRVGCGPSERHRTAFLTMTALVLAMSIESHVRATSEPILPAHNRADQQSIPPRPQEGDLSEKIHKLWESIVRDDPELAAEVFFPKEAFLLVKAMADPGRYYDKLRKRFDRDIHDLHQRTADLDIAVFDRFELARRGGFVAVNQEGNRLPYWASRHSIIYYRVRQELRRLEVRVLITWDDRWYVIHLNEFK
jgi:hypothetical protein